MKRISLLLFVFIFTSLLFTGGFMESSLAAQGCSINITSPLNIIDYSPLNPSSIPSIEINNIPLAETINDDTYFIRIRESGREKNVGKSINNDGNLNTYLDYDAKGRYLLQENSDNHVELYRRYGFGQQDQLLCTSIEVVHVGGYAYCNITAQAARQADGKFKIGYKFTTIHLDPGSDYDVSYNVAGRFDFNSIWVGKPTFPMNTGSFTLEAEHEGKNVSIAVGDYQLIIATERRRCKTQVFLYKDLPVQEPIPEDPQDSPPTQPPPIQPPSQPPEGEGEEKLPPGQLSCNEGKGIDTAIGCIPIGNSSELIGFILRWAIGIGGGIAFLLMVYAGFIIMTSTGNPERLKGGQELLTSALAGLIMLIFSVFILRIIGIDILQIPGFGG